LATILAVILGLLAVWFFGLFQFSLQRQIELNSYIAYLLLSDEIRESHKATMLEFIRNQPGDAMQVTTATHGAIAQMARELAGKNSQLAAHALIWKARGHS
jgi:hypothetical protein